MRDRDRALEQRCRQAIEDLHVFFERWLGGALPETDEAFAPLEAALAPDFSFVTPAGKALDRATLVTGLRAGHGGHPGLEIGIENVRVVVAGRDLVVAEYEEWQRFASGEDTDRADSGRRSTVIFEAAPADSSREAGLTWRRVHETWIERT